MAKVQFVPEIFYEIFVFRVCFFGFSLCVENIAHTFNVCHLRQTLHREFFYKGLPPCLTKSQKNGHHLHGIHFYIL